MKVNYYLQNIGLGKVEGESRITIGTTLHDLFDDEDEDDLDELEGIEEESDIEKGNIENSSIENSSIDRKSENEST